jgi:hypothetical protein
MGEENAIPTTGMEAAVNLPPQEGLVVSKDEEEEHRGDLLDQFYLTLGVMLLAAPKDERPDVHGKLQWLFVQPRSWRNAYELEQLLCLVMSEPQLTVELKRRLAEAKALKLDYLDVVEEGLKDTVVGNKRIAFQRLLNDLQWFYVKRVQQRSAGKRLMRRVSALFVLSALTLFLVLLIQFFAHPVVPQSASNAPATPGQSAAATPQPAPAAQPTPATPQPAPANGAAK